MLSLNFAFVMPFFVFDHVYSAIVNVSFTINAPVIDLSYQYKLDKGEVFTRIEIKKDGQTFLEFTDPNNQTYTPMPGIGLVKTSVGKVTIKNFNQDTFGRYDCRLYYGFNGYAEHYVTAKYNIKLTVDPCKMVWKNTTIGNFSNIADPFIAGYDTGARLMVCRTSIGTPGYIHIALGCIDTMGGRIEKFQEFQVLTGTGFDWFIQTDKHETPPSNALVFGKDNTGNLYLGRCNKHNSAFIGKISDKFYYNYNGTEVNDCNGYHDLLLC